MTHQTNTRINLSGRLAVVSGGTRNIGRAVTLALLKVGCNVLVTYRQQATSVKELKLEAKKLVSESNSIGILYVMRADASSTADWKKVEEKTRTIGGASILINVVGDWHEGKLINTNIETIDQLYQSNLRSVFLGSTYMVTQLSKASNARIINFTCAGAQKLEAKRGTPAYFIFKHAVLSITLTMARELASLGITVNAIAPGYTEWVNIPAEHLEQIYSLIPSQRLGNEQDVTHALYSLLDPAADYLTGTQIIISGGLSI